MKTKKKELPKWFNGEVYTEGGEVINPFSKEKIELNNLELSMYDFIMGANMMAEMGMITLKTHKDMLKGLTWFRQSNPEAYMVLLD